MGVGNVSVGDGEGWVMEGVVGWVMGWGQVMAWGYGGLSGGEEWGRKG